MKKILFIILTSVFVSAHAQNKLSELQLPEGFKLPATYQTYFNNLPSQALFNKPLKLNAIQTKNAISLKKAFVQQTANETKNLLDSIITLDTISGSWVNSTKTISIYDIKGRPTCQKSFQWNLSSNSWVNYSNYLITYDHNGYINSYIYQTGDSKTNTWINITRFLDTTNDAGLALNSITQNWDTITKAWINASQFLCSIGINELDSIILYQNWDKATAKWVNSNRVLYNYDLNGNLISDTSQNWDSGSQKWVNSTIESYFYDNNGIRLKRNTQALDLTKGTWYDSQREFFTYYNNGKILSDTTQTFNSNTNTWDNSILTIFNENGKLVNFVFYGYSQILNKYNVNDTSSTSMRWDVNSQSWINSSYIVYLKNMSSDYIYYTWDINSNTWIKTFQSNYYYSLHNITNKNIPVLSWSTPDDITYGTLLSDAQLNAQADVAGTFTYTPAAGTKLEVGDNQKLLVHFQPQDTAQYLSTSDSISINVLSVTGTSVLQKHTINVYPNPVVNTLYVTNSQGEITYTIFDLTGKVVASGKTNNNQIDIPSLTQGIYTIKISDRQGSLTGRFVKQ